MAKTLQTLRNVNPLHTYYNFPVGSEVFIHRIHLPIGLCYEGVSKCRILAKDDSRYGWATIKLLCGTYTITIHDVKKNGYTKPMAKPYYP